MTGCGEFSVSPFRCSFYERFMGLHSSDLYTFGMFTMLQNKVYLKQLLQDSLGKHSQIFLC